MRRQGESYSDAILRLAAEASLIAGALAFPIGVAFVDNRLVHSDLVPQG